MSRSKIIDIMKFIGIVLMVLGHSGFVYTGWIYQFHMALFFMIAGYCFKEKYSEDLQGIKKLVISRIKSLYIPCLIFSTFIVVFHNVFVKVNLTSGGIYSLKTTFVHLIKCLLFSGGESLSGAMWFLRTMFLSTILFAIVVFIFKKNRIAQTFVCLFLTCIGYALSFLSFGKYFNFLSVMILFEIGFLIKRKTTSLTLVGYKKYIAMLLGFLGTSFPMLFIKEAISLKSNYIINPIYFIIFSIVGFVFVCGLANIFNNLKIANLMAYIGNHTLPIVMFHYLAMKIVTLIGILYYNDGIIKLVEYPFAYTGGVWCLLYTLVGVLVPIGLDLVYRIIKSRLFNVKRSST